MSKIKVSSVTKGQLPSPGPESTPIPMYKVTDSSVTEGQLQCPEPAPTPIPMPRPEPTDAPRQCPPPPPFFRPGPCCPSTTQVVDNITVQSLDLDKIEVVEGTYLGMKAFGIDAKTFEGIGTTGMVPMPKEGDEGKVLSSTGEWSIIEYQVDQELNPESANAVSNKAVCAGLSAVDGKINELDKHIQSIPLDEVHEIIDPETPEDSLDFDNEGV